MWRTSLVAALLIGAAPPLPANATITSTGELCFAAIPKDDGLGRGYYSDEFTVRVNSGPPVPLRDERVLISGIPLLGQHLIAIADKGQTIESFRFVFSSYESTRLCLWYKPWYRTWSLWDAAQGGRKCDCWEDSEARRGTDVPSNLPLQQTIQSVTALASTAAASGVYSMPSPE